MTWLAILAAISILIGFNALYVAAEFATVSSRRSRLTQIAGEGNRGAGWLLGVVNDPVKLDNYVAACQLGITASSLLLGFYGQGQVTAAITPLLTEIGLPSDLVASGVTATAVLIVLTTVQAVMGELVPKNIGVRFPERLALSTVLPMRWSVTLFRPLIWLFNGSSRLIMRVVGLTPTTEGLHVHSPEEIMMLVEESSAGGLLDEHERRLLHNTLRWRTMPARQAMIPRTRILAAPIGSSRQSLLELLAVSPYSRLPLYEGTADNIVGVVHLKDLMCAVHLGEDDVRRLLRPLPFFPENTPAAEVFAQLQHQRDHMAVLLDEFGGTEGLVALEDLIESIFGELQDEFDMDAPPVQVVPGERVLVRGDTLVSEVNEWLNLFLDSDDADTIGGLVLSRFGHVPAPGESVDVGGVEVRVETMDGKGIAAVSLPVTTQQISALSERASW